LEEGRFKQTRRAVFRRALLPPFVTAMLLCGSLVYYFTVYARSRVESDLLRIASDHRRLIDEFLSERVADLRFSVSFYDLEAICAEGRLEKLFADLQSSSKGFFDLGVFDDKGNHRAYVGPFDLAGKNYADAAWFKALQGTDVYVSDVFLGYRNIPHFILAVRKEDDGSRWYLRATIDTACFDELVEGIRIAESGEAYLVNRAGVLQSNRQAKGRLMEQDPDYGVYRIDPGAGLAFSTGRLAAHRYVYATQPLEQVGWILVVRQEMRDAYASLTHAVLVAVAIVVIGGTVVVFLAFALASGLSHQLALADVEKREMRTQLIIAGRLAEVGEMSAGLAHEINNPLQVMKSEQAMIEDILCSLEKPGGQPGPEDLRLIRESAEQINTQIERCKEITQGLLRFSRKEQPSIRLIALEDFLPEAARMIQRRADNENISILQEVDPDLPPVVGDRNQLQQVFLNLLNNAVHALGPKGGGHIRISAARDGNSAVLISVADDGCGIRPEHMDKIFHPFFTTKPVGEGTGLGLSTVYGIVERLGGQVSVTSELNAGTVFAVRLPVALPTKRNDEIGATGRSSPIPAEEAHYGRHETATD